MSKEADKKTSHRGGKRAGAGRKKRYGSPMKTVRIPETLEPTVLELREYVRHNMAYRIVPEDALTTSETLSTTSAPLFATKIAAGFPSPAEDDVQASLDLNAYFIHHPASTFFLRATGDSMDRAGITEDTILQVDKALDVRHGDIVVAAVNGEFTVKRYRRDQQGRVGLHPESSNPVHTPFYVEQGRDISIWGVVSAIHHKLR